MSNFTYEAVDAGGLKVEGRLEVVDQTEAIRRVKEMGLFPVRIVQLRSPRARARGKAEGGKRKTEGRSVPEERWARVCGSRFAFRF